MKRTNSVIRCTLAFVLAVIMFIGSTALADIKATVFTSSMNVYSRTSASSKYLLGALKKGTEFSVKSSSGDWAKIEYKGHTGYARVSDIKSKQKITMYANKATSVYQKASSTSKALCKIGVNAKVYVVGLSGSYYLVENGGGVTGYIQKKNLSTSRTAVTVYSNRVTTVYYTASTSRPYADVNINTKFKAVGTSGSYTAVEQGGKTYYVKTAHLSSSKSSVKRITAYTNSECPVYKRASASSGKLATVGINTKVYAVGMSGSYFAVTSTDGKVFGFIAKSKLSDKKTTVAEPVADTKKKAALESMPERLKSTKSSASSGASVSDKIEAAIYYAQSKLGCSYAPKPNNTTTFDCLTLCYYAFSRVGARIPSTSYACGYTGDLKYIESTNDLKRGDIVCFDTIDTDSDKSDHVGIYLGDGYFIHASSGAGLVTVSNMNSGFYKNCFYKGRRVLG